MKRMIVMFALVVGGAAIAPAHANKEKATDLPRQAPQKSLGKEKPDILFIAIDDLNDWTTLFDKDNPIKTPNLERLAQRGCFFTRAYCTTAACNPSRTSILTGLKPTTSGVYSNRQEWKKLLPNVVTLPQYFTQNGYATKGGGKIFHHGRTGEDREDNPSFQEFFKLKIHAHYPGINYNGYREGDEGVGPLWKPGFDWGEHDAEKQTDEYTVEYVNKVMQEQPKDKPLFLAAGFFVHICLSGLLLKLFKSIHWINSVSPQCQKVTWIMFLQLGKRWHIQSLSFGIIQPKNQMRIREA